MRKLIIILTLALLSFLVNAQVWLLLDKKISSPRISITNTTSNSITLSWEGRSYINYLIEYSFDKINYTAFAYASGNSFVCSGLSTDTTYFFRLKANNNRLITPSNVITAKTLTEVITPVNLLYNGVNLVYNGNLLKY
jgi:hypothetical protein